MDDLAEILGLGVGAVAGKESGVVFFECATTQMRVLWKLLRELLNVLEQSGVHVIWSFLVELAVWGDAVD